MTLDEMTLKDVNERLDQLDVEVREAQEVEAVEAATEEKKQLLERKKELEAVEQRNEAAAQLTEDSAPAVVVETRNEEKIMEKTFAVDTIEYRDAYMKSLMGKPMDVEERGALTSASSVIPTETLNQIYGKLAENPLIGKLNALHIPGYVSVPKATSINDASWLAMSTESTDSEDVIGSVALTAKKLIKTIEITADIQAMSIPAFQSWLVNKLTEKMEAAICAAVINGAGSSTVPTGITTAVTVTSGVTSVSIANLAALMAAVGSAYHSGAIWIMSAEMFFTNVLPLAQDSNGVVVTTGIDQRVFGHEVVFDDNAGDNIIFGNLGKGYVFNYGEGIAIEADQSVAFRSGSTVYRAMALCDGAVVDEDAFAYAAIA